MENIKDLFGKAFKISLKAKFKIRVYDGHGFIIEDEKELTYLELGTYLISNKSEIEHVHIFLRKI